MPCCAMLCQLFVNKVLCVGVWQANFLLSCQNVSGSWSKKQHLLYNVPHALDYAFVRSIVNLSFNYLSPEKLGMCKTSLRHVASFIKTFILFRNPSEVLSAHKSGDSNLQSKPHGLPLCCVLLGHPCDTEGQDRNLGQHPTWCPGCLPRVA